MSIDSRGGDISFSSLNFRQPDFKTTHQERKTTLTTQVESILLSRDESTSPSSIFQELAALEPVDQTRTLFSDKPSLYDQYHQHYLNEIQTSEGSQKRQQDILALTKRGISNSDFIYDQLRSRGVSSQDIVALDTENLNQPNLNQGIDRLYSLDLFDPQKIWPQDETYWHQLRSKIRILSPLTDQEFSDTKDQINHFTFLKGIDIVDQVFGSGKKLSPQKMTLLRSIQTTFFSNPDDEQKFDEYIPLFRKYGIYDREDKNSLVSFLFTDDKYSKGKTFQFIETIIDSGIKSGLKIDIPPEIRESAKPDEQKLLDAFTNLSSRYEQNFLSKMINDRKFSDKQSLVDYFVKNGRPRQEFYLNMIREASESDPKIIIPDYIISDLSSDRFFKSDAKFIQLLNQLPNLSHQKILSNMRENSYSDFSYFYTKGKPNIQFYRYTLKQLHTPTDFIQSENLDHLSQKEKKAIKIAATIKTESEIYASSIREFVLSDLNQIDIFFNQNNQPTSEFLKALLLKERYSLEDLTFLQPYLTPEYLSTFPEPEQKMWLGSLKLKLKEWELSKVFASLDSDKSLIDQCFTENNEPTFFFFKHFSKNLDLSSHFLKKYQNLTGFTPAEKSIFDFFIDKTYPEYREKIIKFLLRTETNALDFFSDDHFTSKFFIELAQQEPLPFIANFGKQEWVTVFGEDDINQLLSNLPESTDEKRNAFTHNEYDRTSKFFEFLVKDCHVSLDREHFKIASEYIKKYGFAKSTDFYEYFEKLTLYQQGLLHKLPEEFIENKIQSLTDLDQQFNQIKKICFGSNSIIDFSKFTELQQELLSIATNHSTNRWTRTPIETIISDFSQDSAGGKIAKLPDTFHTDTISAASIKVESDQKISDSLLLTQLTQELLSSLESPDSIESEKKLFSQILNKRIQSLSEKLLTISENKQEFIKKQIDYFNQNLHSVSDLNSTDSLLNTLIQFNLNLGLDQENYNSILRQLVFKKAFIHHQISPDWQERIRINLQGENTVKAVESMDNFIQNTIKDHVLNFESQNSDGYWDDTTFSLMRQYSSVFKKNLSLSSFTNEINSFQESFKIIELNHQQKIALIPDRGLIGEMSGYMADVCYTKVYPLLKQYPNLVPYKFVVNPDSDTPEFIGSTLIFKVDSKEGEPVFLIRAFDIPKENDVNIGKFFESFTDHLSQIAKNMGVKKILTAGTKDTISNYSSTIKYVISKYVRDKKTVSLKNSFNFNGYDITDQCYLVRDLS